MMFKDEFVEKYICPPAWKTFIEEGLFRYSCGLKKPKFILHMLVFVVIVGGLGAAITFVRSVCLELAPLAHFLSALSMYSLTVVTSTYADSILVKDEEYKDSDKYDMTFPFTCAFVIVAGISVCGIVLSYFPQFELWNVGVSIAALACAIAFWWQVNAPDGKWGDPTSPTFAKGNPDDVPDGPSAAELSHFNILETE